jgi:hypothetical protein
LISKSVTLATNVVHQEKRVFTLCIIIQTFITSMGAFGPLNIDNKDFVSPSDSQNVEKLLSERELLRIYMLSDLYAKV